MSLHFHNFLWIPNLDSEFFISKIIFEFLTRHQIIILTSAYYVLSFHFHLPSKMRSCGTFFCVVNLKMLSEILMFMLNFLDLWLQFKVKCHFYYALWIDWFCLIHLLVLDWSIYSRLWKRESYMKNPPFCAPVW